MAKEENMMYLERFIVSNDFESLLKRYFYTDERTIEVCASMAFWDMIRTYRGYLKMPDTEKKALRATMAKWVACNINEFFMSKISKRDEFDLWHNKICEGLREESEKHIDWFENNKLPYGTVQYILNTTFMNMLIMERWDNHLDPIREFLHVPVDTIVIKAAGNDFEITVPRQHGGVGIYSGERNNENKLSKLFKSWTHNEYIKFQDDVRNAVTCPIKWVLESKAKQYQNRKEG